VFPGSLCRFPELPVVVLGFGLSAAWEFVQSPLYADHGRDLGYLLRTRLHCAGGDTLILLFAFGATSLIFRSRQWLSDNRRGPPQWLVIPVLLALILRKARS
jgi:hypothetical protein